MLASLTASFTFTSPSAYIATPQRTPAASMATSPVDSIPGLIGLAQREWPTVYDSTTTLGEFSHTSVCSTDEAGRVLPATKAASIPVDSVPKILGLAQREWPTVYDSNTTLGEFSHTSVCSTDEEGRVFPATKAASIPVDSVPKIIGLSQRTWPSDRDRSATLGSFMHMTFNPTQ